MSNLYIGVMSGTSLDGIDLVICDIDNHACKLVSKFKVVFPLELKSLVLNVINTSVRLKEIGTLDFKLGLLFANAINEFISRENIDPSHINAIGLHGQTLWHEPDSEYPFSMQLGDANVVTAKTNIKTVADFRRMDIANGGQGAPLVPAFHKFLFSKIDGNIAVLNIGGMANITLLHGEIKGWDTGCGNTLLDLWMSKTRHKAYDKEGAFAKSGNINEELLCAMINDSYFKKLPPKSTGREYFNDAWLRQYLLLFDFLRDEDIQRTLLELTALSVVNDLEDTNTMKLIVCGGGSKNSFLMQRLTALCNCEVTISDKLGIDSDFLEAMAFAWLARKRICEQTVELSSVTGATKNSILGAVYG